MNSSIGNIVPTHSDPSQSSDCVDAAWHAVSPCGQGAGLARQPFQLRKHKTLDVGATTFVARRDPA